MGEYELQAAAFTKAEQARDSSIVVVVGAESEENTATNRGVDGEGGDGDCRQAGRGPQIRNTEGSCTQAGNTTTERQNRCKPPPTKVMDFNVLLAICKY